MKLTEDHAKRLLEELGLPVPDGGVALSAQEAEALAQEFGGAVALKALIPAGRRGKAGLVRLAHSAAESGEAARALLGTEALGHTVDRLYVERLVPIAREFYISFAFSDRAPRIVISSKGGVDIEQVFAEEPQAVVQREIDPLRGLTPWDAIELWSQTGLSGRALASVARVSSMLYDAFVACDAQMLEVNPLALDVDDGAHLVGAMMDIDDDAVFRHPELAQISERNATQNPRERLVAVANRSFPGGDSRYTELNGDIGLLVAGGGAGLLQHDLIVGMGGRPANHSDMSPAPGTQKLEAVLDAIFTNPNTRSLLVGYNYLQMAPCDQVMVALKNSVDRNKVDTTRFPIVIRLFGPREAEARAIAATMPGIQYLRLGATLEEGARAVVEANARVTTAGQQAMQQ